MLKIVRGMVFAGLVGVGAGLVQIFHFRVEFFLVVIAAILVMIDAKLGSIDERLKARFPNAREQDAAWAQADPMGHWEAHEKASKRSERSNAEN